MSAFKVTGIMLMLVGGLLLYSAIDLAFSPVEEMITESTESITDEVIYKLMLGGICLLLSLILIKRN